MNAVKTIEWMLVASACVACDVTPSASLLGLTTYVTDSNSNALPATDPNESLQSSVQFVISTNWQNPDPNVTGSSPGMNLMAMADPNLCIDIANGNVNPNTPVQTWACNGYDPAQAWFLYNGQLHSQAGLCLDIAGDDIQQDLQLVTQACDTTGTRRSQFWNFTGGVLQIVGSNRCLSLDVPGNGALPHLADCNVPDKRQQWVGARSDGAHIRGMPISTAVANSACLYVADSNQVGTPLSLHACDFGIMEQFVLEGTYLRALGKCVQANNLLGASLTLADCSTDVSQQWVWNNGILYLGADSKKCAGLVNSNAANDAPLQVQTCTSAASQQWSLGTAGY